MDAKPVRSEMIKALFLKGCGSTTGIANVPLAENSYGGIA
jgi:hypothetical protein